LCSFIYIIRAERNPAGRKLFSKPSPSWLELPPSWLELKKSSADSIAVSTPQGFVIATQLNEKKIKAVAHLPN